MLVLGVLLCAHLCVATLDLDLDQLASASFSEDCLEFSVKTTDWFYRYCHKRYIEQIIPISATEKRSFILGRWSQSESLFTQDKDDYLYSYFQGDSCGGQHRIAVARLSCSSHVCGLQGGQSHISKVTETSTCVYVVEICALSLCSSISTNVPQSANKVIRGDNPYRMSEQDRMEQLDRIKAIFYHGYDSYMKHAFPFDELKPLTCSGVNTDLTPGGMLTLIDSLDTLVVMGNITEFHRVVKILSRNEESLFQADTKISVFETTIRIMGGLLSAHMFCVDDELGFRPADYDGALLRMARDLGNRLLPAFDTSTTIPYGTVHLLHGVPLGETTEACTAAAGSLSLEFGMLSVLTGDQRYGKAAKSSLKTLYDLRSPLNLLGRHLDVNSGKWTEAIAGIGSNIDSVYEYYLKQYILFGDDECLEWFEVLYEGAVRHLRMAEGNGRFYQEIDMKSGKVVRRYFSALQAFFPGVQILLGDLRAALKSLNGFLAVWEFTNFLPEDFDLVRWTSVKGSAHTRYLLRPELAESIYYAYRATKDESWLEAGKDIIDSVSKYCFVPDCGYATIDVETKRQQDAMPSYFLSEWIKYLYLLFDDGNFINQGNYVFNTEAHPFRVTNQTQRNKFRTSFHFREKKERQAKFSSVTPLNDIDSLELEEDVCLSAHELELRNNKQQLEGYYKVSSHPNSSNRMPTSSATSMNFQFRPFTNGVAPDVPVSDEKRVAGYLEGVGMFEIVSTANSFMVHHINRDHRLTISNLDSTTCMVTTNAGHNPIFVSLDMGIRFQYGKTCHIKVFSNATVCTDPLLWGSEPSEHGSIVLEESSCGVADGFGYPAWSEFETALEFPIVTIGNALHLCDTEMEQVSSSLVPFGGLFFVHARRGKCSFEEKAQNARLYGAKGVVVSLQEAKDEPFIMVHTSNNGFRRESVIAFLAKNSIGRRIERSNLPSRGMVELRAQPRVTNENGKITISIFPKWIATFGPLDEQGQFRLTLHKDSH